jgi:CheY-like chemotaxis protein
MPVSVASIGDGAGSRRWTGALAGTALREAECPVVLFVEDQLTVRYTVAEHLADAGYAVVQAGSGEDALALLPALPVIYASAYSYVTPRQVPGSMMLDKPYPPEALEALLG